MKKSRRTYRSGSSVPSLLQGGTGKTTQFAALTALRGIGKGKLGAAEGVLNKNSAGRISSNVIRNSLANQVTISGNKKVYLNEDAKLFITNFDIMSIYSVDSYYLSVSLNPDSRRLYSPNGQTYTTIDDVGIDDNKLQTIDIGLYDPNFVNPITLTVTRNNVPRTIELTGIRQGVISPEFVHWKTNQLVSRHELTIQLKAFETHPVNQDIHTSTDWEIFTDADCTKRLFGIINDRQDRYTKVIKGSLAALTDFWIRVRFKGAASGYSPYRVIKVRTTND